MRKSRRTRPRHFEKPDTDPHLAPKGRSLETSRLLKRLGEFQADAEDTLREVSGDVRHRTQLYERIRSDGYPLLQLRFHFSHLSLEKASES